MNKSFYADSRSSPSTPYGLSTTRMGQTSIISLGKVMFPHTGTSRVIKMHGNLEPLGIGRCAIEGLVKSESNFPDRPRLALLPVIKQQQILLQDRLMPISRIEGLEPMNCNKRTSPLLPSKDQRVDDSQGGQKKFLSFINALLCLLSEYGEHRMKKSASSLVKLYAQRSRLQDRKSCPFRGVLIQQLKQIVPPQYWILTRETLGYGYD